MAIDAPERSGPERSAADAAFLIELLTVAVAAARRAGPLVREGLSADRAALDTRKKGDIDLVTAVDREAEAVIVDHVRAAFPHHHVVAEERGGEARDAGLQWVIDPLDGTTNFAHGHPQCAVSVAVLDGPRPLVGAVYDPARDELFTATAGGGAQLNGRPLAVSSNDALDQSLLGTGFAYDRRERADDYVPVFQHFMVLSQGVRRMGSASLDLAWLAAGRLDGFWEIGLHPWDVAAAVLLVTEAGGRVSDYEGRPLSIWRPDHIVASNGRLHDAVLDVLASHRELW